MPVSLSFLGSRLRVERPAGDRAFGRPRGTGWDAKRLGRLWLLVVVACGVAAALG